MTAPQIGFSTMLGSRAMADLPAQLDFIAGLGVDAAELSALRDDLIVGAKVLPGRLALLKSMVADRPLRYSLHAAVGLNFMVSPAHLAVHEDVAKAYVELSAEVGARHVVLHTGMYPMTWTQSEIAHAYDQQRAALVRLGDFAAGHGCLICVENVYYWNQEHTATPAELARELALIDHDHVCATFDFGHGALALNDVGEAFVTQAAALTPYAQHLHLHDNFGRRNLTRCYTQSEEVAFGEGDLHLPLNWGALPWDALGKLAYPANPLVMIELNPAFWREAEEMVAQTRAWAGQLAQQAPALDKG